MIYKNIKLEFTRENLLDFLLKELGKRSKKSDTESKKIKALSFKGLEKRAGISRDTLRDFARGKAHVLRADKLQKVLNALGYDLRITKLGEQGANYLE